MNTKIKKIIKNIIKEYYGDSQKDYTDQEIMSDNEYQGVRQLYILISNLILNIKKSFFETYSIKEIRPSDKDLHDKLIEFINNKFENYDINKFKIDTKNKNSKFSKISLNKNIVLDLNSKIKIDDKYHIVILSKNDPKGIYGINYHNSKTAAHSLNKMQVYKLTSFLRSNPEVAAGISLNSDLILFKNNNLIKSTISHEVQHILDADLEDLKQDKSKIDNKKSIISKIEDLNSITEIQKEKLKFEYDLIEYLCSESELRAYSKQLADLYGKLVFSFPNRFEYKNLNYSELIKYVYNIKENKFKIKNSNINFILNSLPFYYYKDFTKNKPTENDILRIENETGYKIIDKNENMQNIFLDRLLITDINLRNSYINMFDIANKKLEKYSKFFWQKYYLRSDDYVIKLTEYFLHGEGKNYLKDKNNFIKNINDILDLVIKKEFNYMLVDWENSKEYQKQRFIKEIIKNLNIRY